MAKAEEGTTLSAQEKAAVKERTRELKAAKKGAEAEQAVLDAISALSADERPLAERVHALIRQAAPELAPRTWYGMPAYAKDGKVICFFKAASKFDVRYAELGFNEPANLDDGNMWPTAYAITKVTAAEEKKIRDLVKTAAS
ncbi:iron chaperone [Ornithinimicrobium cryptoxanthini]|uniref:DUF1801 domain-containing protein n=1 Tax=Ornithinimicrobium cryptoxanthini TaxID=2934161 RepID=A0ABY4YKC1_9MICO|nr:DUF1801 domain-containing protein [Ornithinimicrobium cryptoxanthini]USQ76773.1 DUF1801 domain-containing protein [Ornithinimicrobium cryptoxanthini]